MANFLTIPNMATTRLAQLEDCPSLKPILAEAAGRAYGDGVRLASRETGLPIGYFPEDLPYALNALLDDDWLPGAP